MLESAEDSNPTANLPYGLLISQILSESQVDLSGFKATEVSTTYDSCTFTSMSYTLIDGKQHKKYSLKGKADAPKLTRISVDSAALPTKAVDNIMALPFSLANAVQDVQENIIEILLSRDFNTELGKLRMEVEELKKGGVRSVNKLIKQVDSLSTGVNSSNNELAVSIQNAYSYFSMNSEKSYDSFYRNMLNTLKYFLGHH